MKVSRKEFVQLLVVFVGSGGALTSACTSSSSGGTTSSGDAGSSGSSGSSASADAGDEGTDAGGNAIDSGDGGGSNSHGTNMDAGDASGGDCPLNGAKGTFLTNHPTNPHTIANVPSADFNSLGSDKTYPVTAGGGNLHTHTITLTAAERTQLSYGQAVTKDTNPDATLHTHQVQISCL